MKVIDGIDGAEGSHVSYQFFEHGSKRFIAKVVQTTSDMDRITVTDGEMPKAANEIAVEGYWAKDQGFEIGDKVCVSEGSDTRVLKETDFVITAFAESPEYSLTVAPNYELTSDKNLPIDTVMFANEEVFDLQPLGGYEEVLLRSDRLREHEYGSNEYKTALNELKEAIAPSIEEM